jgi:hypothetical protein
MIRRAKPRRKITRNPIPNWLRERLTALDPASADALLPMQPSLNQVSNEGIHELLGHIIDDG